MNKRRDCALAASRYVTARSQRHRNVTAHAHIRRKFIAFTHVDDYVTTNPLGTPAWQARLDETRLGDAAPSAPVFQYHALVDEIVPFDQAARLRRTWCDRGAAVTWAALAAEHALGLVEGRAPAVAWLSARFAGAPAPGNCPLPG